MEKQSETEKEKCSKIHQDVVSNVITIPPNKMAAMGKIEMLSSAKLAEPLVTERSNCLYPFSQLFCFFLYKPETHLLNNSEVYQTTTEPRL